MIEFCQQAWYRITLKIQNVKPKEVNLFTTKINKLFRDRDGYKPIKAELFNNEFVIQQIFYFRPELLTSSILDNDIKRLSKKVNLIILENKELFQTLPLLDIQKQAKNN